MKVELDSIEVRILGVLLEKEHTTPEYYPLTANALMLGCNQKSNRSPVVGFDEETVYSSISTLRDKRLVVLSSGAGSRVSKYKHSLDKELELTPPELAALSIMMLRGPQTLGEIRGRSARIYEFADLREVEETLTGLQENPQGPFVKLLPRSRGQKDSRYAHLLSGEPEINEEQPLNKSTATVNEDRLDRLSESMESLRAELMELKQEFIDFKEQFD